MKLSFKYFGTFKIFFEKHNTNINAYTRTSTHPYEYKHTHPTPMSTSKKLSRFNLEIHKVSHQEHLTVDGDIVFH
jgi:hypothetical protein